MLKTTHIIVAITMLLSGLIQPDKPPAPELFSPAAAESPQALIAAINAYRTANGLHALNYDASLMVSAQAQADYMASTRIVSHEGPGGSSPKDRAIAAGYGGGSTVFGSEIIYGGSYATIEVAMGWWKLSPNHNPWMLYDGYYDIGAGIAYVPEDNYAYFAVTMFYKSGASGPIATLDPNVTPVPTNPPAAIIVPVVAAAPAEDGSITHTVRTGQSMWNISAVYGVELQTLYDLNGMTKWDVIYPGDEILVRPPDSQAGGTEISFAPTSETPENKPDSQTEGTASFTPTRTPDISKTPVSTPTSRYSPTPTQPIVLNINGESTPIGDTAPEEDSIIIDQNLLIIIGIAFLTLIAILAVSLFSKPHQDET